MAKVIMKTMYELCYCIKKDNGQIITKYIKNIANISDIDDNISNIYEDYIYRIYVYKNIVDNVSYYDSTSILYNYNVEKGMFYSDNDNIILNKNNIALLKSKLE